MNMISNMIKYMMTRPNENTENENTENGICHCVYGFYQHSRKFFILLFCMIAVLGGILFLISRL